MQAPRRSASGGDIAGLKSRAEALRQAALLPEAERQTLLDAALAELDGAIAALAESAGGEPVPGAASQALSDLHSERRLLQAVFTATPTPLYIIDQDGTVLRANAAACELLGVGPGYATGRSLTSLIEPAARAAARSQLAAVRRTGRLARLACGMLSDQGVVGCELVIAPVNVRGDADRLLVSVGLGGAPASPAGRTAGSGDKAGAAAGTVGSMTARLDLLAEAARTLLESASVSESVLLQRCARLISGQLATWAIVDVHRRGQLRRHHVAGPDDGEAAALAHAAATVDPGPGSLPDRVYESGQQLVITHADDEMLLGPGPDGRPLLTRLGGACVLSVPMTDGSRRYGVLTLVRRADDGQFGLAECALAAEIGSLLGLAISGRRTLRRRTEAADALRASLLPPVLKPVPGVEIAAAHLPPSRGREVGGDFYDVYPTPGGWGVAIGDVCGKGEDAAAATAAARHAIRVLAYANGDPAQVLRGANDIMLAEGFGGRFVTASAAHLSWQGDTLKVVLATAGHPGPMLVKPEGRARLVPGGGVALGIFPDPEPATLELELINGDVLFFYTDGLADARSPRATYLEDSLADSLATLAGRRAAEIVSDMRKVVIDFCQGMLRDDLTMLALRAGVPPDQ